MDELKNALYSSFIDKNIVSAKEQRARLVYNDYKENMKMSNELQHLLKECDTFDISVAFIAESGLAAIRETLNTLRNQNKKGRIITSTYLGFNEPKMFKDLLKYPNLEVRVFDDQKSISSKRLYF